MTTKFNFDNAGFQALQNELYLLDDANLAAQAANLAANFSQWLSDHFELSATQISFLADIDPRADQLLRTYSSFAIANRLPIGLKKEEKDKNQGKIIWPKSTLTATAGANGSYEAGGTLEINISYQA